MHIWPDGNIYEGHFVNEIYTGQGTFTSKNGWKYEGDWLNDKKHGHGKLTTSDD